MNVTMIYYLSKAACQIEASKDYLCNFNDVDCEKFEKLLEIQKMIEELIRNEV